MPRQFDAIKNCLSNIKYLRAAMQHDKFVNKFKMNRIICHAAYTVFAPQGFHLIPFPQHLIDCMGVGGS